MTTITEFITARLDEREAVAGERALREVAAMREIVQIHKHVEATLGARGIGCMVCARFEYGIAPEGWCATIRAIAAIWSGHPDYDPAWAPETAEAR